VVLVLARNWWTLVVRGAAAILFGFATFAWPDLTLSILIALFGAFALVDGIFNLVGAARGATHRKERWGWLFLQGLVSLAAAFVTLLLPGLTALALLYWIAAWAVVTGVLEIVTAIRLRREIHGEWLLVLGGIASIVFGALLFVSPGLGALAVVIWIGAYAIVFGALNIGLGLRLRSELDRVEFPRTRTRVPV
jgi:uncharacterized membrane protein HdeD (DUF308 family)